MSMFIVEPEVLWKLATPGEVKTWAEKGFILGTSLDIQDGYLHAADAIAIKEVAEMLYRGLEVELLCIQPEVLPEGTKWMRDDFEDSLLNQCVQSENGAPAYVRRMTSGRIHVHLRKQLPWSAVSQHYSIPVQADGSHVFPGECSVHTKPTSASSMVEVIILGTGHCKSHVYYGEPCTSFAVLVNGHAVLLCDVGSGVVHSAIKELGWAGLPTIVFVSYDCADCAADLPVLLAVEALEKGRQMKVVALPECMHHLKTHRMKEIMKSKMRPLRDFAEWLEVPSGEMIEVDSGRDGCKIVLEAHSDDAKFAGLVITVGEVTISWTADCEITKGNYTVYEELSEYAQLLITHARKDRKDPLALRRNARFEDVISFVQACTHAAFLSEGEGTMQQPISKHRLWDKMEDLRRTIKVKERERTALMTVTGSSFQAQVDRDTVEEQALLLLTGMLLRMKAEQRMTHEVNAALSKTPFERNSHDISIIDSCERFLRTKLEELDNFINEFREKLLAVSTLASMRDEEHNQFCSVAITGYGSRSDAPTTSTGIPRSAVLSAGQRVFLSRMQQTEAEAQMTTRRSRMVPQGVASASLADLSKSDIAPVGTLESSSNANPPKSTITFLSSTERVEEIRAPASTALEDLPLRKSTPRSMARRSKTTIF